MSWPVAALASVADVLDCKHRTPVYTDSGYPVVRPRDVREAGIDLASCITTSQDEFDDLTEKRLPQAGDIVYSRNATFGVASHVRAAEPFAIGQDVCLIVPRTLDSRYLWRTLNSPFVKRQLDGFVSGTTFKRINLAAIRKLSVPLPPLPEQKRIAAILDKADEIRRKRAEAIKLTEELLKSAFLEMFGPAAPGYQSWPEVTFEELARDRKGALRTGPFGIDLRHSEFVDAGVAVLGIDNAVRNRFAWGERRYITADKYEKLKRYTVHPGDVIVTIMGTTGRSAVVPSDIPTAITTKHLATLSLDRAKAEPEFVAQAFHHHPSILKQIEGAHRGAIMNGLNLGLIKSLVVRLPPLEAQRRYASLTQRMRRFETTISGHEVDALSKSLTLRVFSGRL